MSRDWVGRLGAEGNKGTGDVVTQHDEVWFLEVDGPGEGVVLLKADGIGCIGMTRGDGGRWHARLHLPLDAEWVRYYAASGTSLRCLMCDRVAAARGASQDQER